MNYYANYLAHHGVKGQKWGVRRRTRNYNKTLNDYRLFKKMADNAPRDEHGMVVSKAFPKYFRSLPKEIQKGSETTEKTDAKYEAVKRAAKTRRKFDRIRKKYVKIGEKQAANTSIDRLVLNRAADYAAANEIFQRYSNNKRYRDAFEYFEWQDVT